jgi:hypothetical protein
MKKFVTAKLVKLSTDDGMVQMLDGVPLGKEYEVDVNSICVQKMYNMPLDTFHTKEIVWASNGLWLATELLDIPGHTAPKETPPKENVEEWDDTIFDETIIR